MFTFIRGVKPRKQPYDFAMILGGMTPEAKVAGASWDNY